MAQNGSIHFANAAVQIPCASGSVAAVYSSHMIEHLDRNEARAFLDEVKRVLQPGGVVRLAAPDLSRLIQAYVATGDADGFVSGIHMGLDRPAGLRGWLKWALVGPRHHLWMYDGDSLSRLLHDAGFVDVTVVPPGSTKIAEPGELDLWERASESVYAEAARPLWPLWPALAAARNDNEVCPRSLPVPSAFGPDAVRHGPRSHQVRLEASRQCGGIARMPCSGWPVTRPRAGCSAAGRLRGWGSVPGSGSTCTGPAPRWCCTPTRRTCPRCSCGARRCGTAACSSTSAPTWEPIRSGPPRWAPRSSRWSPPRTPSPCCVENIALNGYQVTAVQAAAGDHCGTARFTAGRDAGNSLDPDGPVRTELVTVDSLIGDRHITGMKVDVEGFEIDVLRGCRPRAGRTTGSA